MKRDNSKLRRGTIEKYHRGGPWGNIMEGDHEEIRGGP
jgi:hypothetical protein